MSDEPINRMMHLPDGEYLLRNLNPNDLSRIQEFFYSHTEETVYHRYGHPVKVMSDEDAEKLASINQSKDFALALLEVFGQRQTIHAIGRYWMDPSDNRAEIAFVVRESKRQLGCTTCLMQELIRTARRRHLKALWATVQNRNLPMRRALEKFGFQETSTNRDEIKMELQLSH